MVYEALQKLGDIHNTNNWSETEEAIVVKPDEDIGVEDNEWKCLLFAEKMLGSAVLIPVGEKRGTIVLRWCIARTVVENN